MSGILIYITTAMKTTQFPSAGSKMEDFGKVILKIWSVEVKRL